MSITGGEPTWVEASQPQSSFWKRLFGRKPKQDEQERRRSLTMYERIEGSGVAMVGMYRISNGFLLIFREENADQITSSRSSISTNARTPRNNHVYCKSFDDVRDELVRRYTSDALSHS